MSPHDFYYWFFSPPSVLSSVFAVSTIIAIFRRKCVFFIWPPRVRTPQLRSSRKVFLRCAAPNHAPLPSRTTTFRPPRKPAVVVAGRVCRRLTDTSVRGRFFFHPAVHQCRAPSTMRYRGWCLYYCIVCVVITFAVTNVSRVNRRGKVGGGETKN